jgi:hypothetical protein
MHGRFLTGKPVTIYIKDQFEFFYIVCDQHIDGKSMMQRIFTGIFARGKARNPVILWNLVESNGICRNRTESYRILESSV